MNTSVPIQLSNNLTDSNSTAPFGNPSNLFDATTWVQNYSLLTYLPIWITLISCGVFTAALLVVYYAFFRLLLEQFFLCFGATTAAKSSWRVRFVARYSRTKAPFILMALVTALSAYSCVLFVYSAIQVQVLASPGPILQFFRSPFIIWTEFAVSVIILIDYLFKFTFAPSKWRFAMSLLVIAEMLPTVPGLLGPFVNFYYFGFQFLRFLQFYQSLLYMKHLKLKFFDLYAELVLLVAAALGLLFSTGGFLFIFENKYFNPGGKISTLFEAIYFALITLTTVGYGDFSPVSNLGKIAVCVALLVGFWLIPYHISTSLERYQTWKDSARYKGHGHVIVFSRGAPVMEFIHEFYKKELGLWKAQNMCLMTPEPLNPEERRRLRKPIYEYMISKLKGDIFNEADVKRAGAKKAVACFILSNGISPYMEFLDSVNILRAMSIRHVAPKTEIFMQLQLSEWRNTLGKNFAHIIYIQELQQGLLAQSCVAPGFIALIGNLFTSAKWTKNKQSWIKEYKMSLDYSIQVNIDLEPFVGLSYYDTFYWLYKTEGILLIAVKSLVQEETETMSSRARDYLQFDLKQNKCNVKKCTCCTPPPGKKLRCCWCCFVNQLEDVECRRYGPYRLHPPGDYIISEGDMGAVISDLPRSLLIRRIKYFVGRDKSLQTSAHAWFDASIKQSIEQRKREEAKNQNKDEKEEEEENEKEKEKKKREDKNKNKNKRESNKTEHKENKSTSRDKKYRKKTLQSDVDDNVSKKEKSSKREQQTESTTKLPASSNPILLDKGSVEDMKDHIVICIVEGEEESVPTDSIFQQQYSLSVRLSVTWSDMTHSRSRLLNRLQLEQPMLKPEHLHHPNVVGLVAKLREKPQLNDTPIVILMARSPSPIQIAQLSNFDNVFFVKGSPSDTFDLLRAGAMQAKTVLIVSRDLYGEDGVASFSRDSKNTAAHDAISLMIYRLLEFAPCFPVIRLVYPENCNFLSRDVTHYLFNFHYAAGHVLINSIWNQLLAQAYYKEGLIELTEELILRSHVFHWRVQQIPEYRLGDKFGDIVRILLNYKRIPLGLYRLKWDLKKKKSRWWLFKWGKKKTKDSDMQSKRPRLSFDVDPLETRFSMESRRSLDSIFSMESTRPSMEEGFSYKASSEASERHPAAADSTQKIGNPNLYSEGKLTENERYVLLCPAYETMLHPTDILFVFESPSLEPSTTQ